MANYKLPEVMDALRKADAAGNKEDAQRLAIIAHGMRGNESTTEGGSGTMAYVNRGIAETVGGPVDLITSGLNLIPGVNISTPYGGSKAIEKTMSFLGIPVPGSDRPPQNIPEGMGHVVGQVAGLLNPTALGVRSVAQGAGTIARVGNSVWQSMAKHPYLTMTSEVMGGASAGAGRQVAQKEFPDSPGAQVATELAAGMAGAMAPNIAVHTPSMIAIRSGKNLLHKVLLPFTKKGGKYRAGEHVKGLVSDADAAARSATAETIGDLPPAVASGEKRIVALYKTLVGQDPVTDTETIEKLTSSIIKLEGEMRQMGYGSTELLEEITKKRIAALELRMDRRVLDSLTKAQKRVNTIPYAQRKAAESRIVRDELEGVMQGVQKDVKAAWNKVNKDIPVDDFSGTRATYRALYDDLGQAQRSDIPGFLKENAIISNQKLKSTNVREMQSLRSKLLETARIARKEGKWNRARISQDVADSILDDLENAAGSEFADLKTAIAATKQFKLRFESGETGRILGRSKSGAPAINPDLALEMTVGRLGERGAIDLSKVVATPEARAATERYLGRSFLDYTDPNRAGISKSKAEQWIRTNEAILDEFPQLRKQLSDATSAQAYADDVRVKMDARKKALRDPSISESAAFLNRASTQKEIKGILKSRRPRLSAMQLVKQARKDPSGNALRGLRAGFIEDMFEQAKGNYNYLGQKSLSGGGMLDYINKNESTLRAVFTNDQMKRMRSVGRELSGIETFDKVQPGAKGIELKDRASSFLRMTARLAGARLGGKLGQESMGGSLQYASIFSSRAQKFITWLSKDTAEQLVNDAILSENPALLKSLLKPMAKPTPKKKDLVSLNKNLNLWLASTGGRVLDDIDREAQGE
jgi:hypothetical protein